MSFSQKFKPGYDARNSSLKISESKVFDGILYNLDAEVEDKYRFEEESELYDVIEQIGEGGFSTVHKVIFLATGETMALKIIKEERLTNHVMNLTKLKA